ncbi:choice-of-anchor A family protein [Streptomyces sp. NPDC052052]|uniref:choice-of-anchor A family protein n=1 Tax=Streptomyces sp. NPDC052052 TaxID=3154756 RepID=UPI003445CC3C
MRRTTLVITSACTLCLAAVVPASAEFSGNPIAGNNGFGVLVQEGATLGSTETEGSVAVGGDLTFGPGYNVALHTTGSFIAPGDTQPTALLVGGRVDYAGSAPQGVLRVLNNGYLKIGDPTGSSILDRDSNGASAATRAVAEGAAYDSTPRIELTAHQSAASVTDTTGLPDLDALFATYRDRSDALGTCGTDVVLRDDAGNALDPDSIPPGTRVHVDLTEGRTNVLNLTGEALNNISEMVFDTRPSATTPLIVNTDTTGTNSEYTWHVPNTAGASGEQAPYMLWNFPDATAITMADGDSLEGTVFAPRAHLTDLDPANIEGTVIVKELTAGPLTGDRTGSVTAGEIHEFPFAADVSCGPDTEPSPTPTPTPTESEPTPTPTESEPTPTPTPTESEPTPTPTESEPTPTPTESEPTPTPTPPDPTTTSTTTAPSHLLTPQDFGSPGLGGGYSGTSGGRLADTGTSAALYAAGGALTAVATGALLLGRRRPRRH